MAQGAWRGFVPPSGAVVAPLARTPSPASRWGRPAGRTGATWRRIATVGVTASWGIFEFLMGNHFWGTLFVGIGALSFYGLFITFNPRDPEPKD